jgi:hypothetical protein
MSQGAAAFDVPAGEVVAGREHGVVFPEHLAEHCVVGCAEDLLGHVGSARLPAHASVCQSKASPMSTST